MTALIYNFREFLAEIETELLIRSKVICTTFTNCFCDTVYSNMANIFQRVFMSKFHLNKCVIYFLFFIVINYLLYLIYFGNSVEFCIILLRHLL